MIEDVPDGWTTPTSAQVEFARTADLNALTDDAVERAGRYYDRAGNYAGTTFTELPPTTGFEVTGSDLFAVALLGGPARPPRADARSTRRLLGYIDQGHASRIGEALTKIDPALGLADADIATLEAMGELYNAIKGALENPDRQRSNPWVVASKLCARKRPELFPVRDNEVCSLLGLLTRSTRGSYQRDFLVFRCLISDADIFQRLDQISGDLNRRGPQFRPEQSRLRVLDVALWTQAMWSTPDDPLVEQ